MSVEHSYYIIIVNRDRDFYDEITTRISRNFSDASTRIQLIFRHYDNLVESLQWLQERSVVIENSITPVLMVVIDADPTLLQTFAGGKIRNIHSTFKGFCSLTCYFTEKDQTRSRSIGADLIYKLNLEKCVDRTVELLSEALAARTTSSNTSIIKLLKARNIPIPEHLRDQELLEQKNKVESADPNRPIPLPPPPLNRYEQVTFPQSDTINVREINELAHQLELMKIQGQHAIGELNRLFDQLNQDSGILRQRVERDLHEVKEEQQRDIQELKDRLSNLAKELNVLDDSTSDQIDRLNNSIFKTDFRTMDDSIAGKVYFIEQGIGHIRRTMKDVTDKLNARLDKIEEKIKGIETKKPDDDDSLLEELMKGIFTLLNNRVWAVAIAAIILTTFAVFVFKIPVEELLKLLQND